jgi:peptidoglycan/LPS O-acetylase OafA/YrhL
MITLIYLISPALVLLDKQPWFYRLIFPVLFLAGLFMFNFGFEFSTFESFAFFIPIYIFGMWASRHKEQITAMGYKMLLPLSLIFITLVVLEVTGVLSLDTSYGAYRPEETYDFPFNFGKLKMSILCLVVLNGFYLIRYKNFPVLTLLADYSFGIYFIHLYVIRIFEQVIKALHIPFQFNSSYFLIHVGLITIISCLLIFFIKKLTGKYSRHFIGS